MDEDASQLDSCQLQSRYWIIVDENGKVETVQGYGVTGNNETHTKAMVT